MSKFYTFATAAVMAMTAFSVSAQEATLTMDPAPGTYETLPDAYTLTVEGPVSIKKDILAGNFMTFIKPDGTRVAAAGITVNTTNNTVTFKPQATIDLTAEGDYVIEMKAGALTYTWEDGTTSKSTLNNFNYTVGVDDPYAVKYTLSPAPGEYEELPAEFTITVDGPQSISKNILAANPIMVVAPNGTKTQVPGTYTAGSNVITCKVPASCDRTQSGEYSVSIRANSINLMWPDGTKTTSVDTPFTYTVGGQGGGQDEPQPVAYDIEIKGFQPKLDPLDLEMKTLETLQIVFNMPNLAIDPEANAMVTISGPDYKQTAQLRPNMPTVGNFKALFQDPKYNGEYTLTIPQGVLGDAEWIENHEFGHANAAVDYKFTVVGGKEYVGGGVTSTFNPIVTPGTGSRVQSLSRVSLEFESTPYFKEGASVNVTYKADLQGGAAQYGKATVEQGAENELILVFNPAPKNQGQYLLTLPAGTFWNEEHENDAEAGQINGALDLDWYYVPAASAKIDSHVPATDAKVGAFEAGKPGIVINTNNNDEVAELKVTITGYEMGNDSARPVTIVNNATSTEKNAEGAICWIPAETIVLDENFYYEVDAIIYNADGVKLDDTIFEFYGDFYSGVGCITIDTAAEYYNLQGVRVANPGHGLYIRVQDGKAVKVVR